MDLIKEINAKYLALESELDKKLEKVKIEEEKLEKQTEKLVEKSANTTSTKVLSYEQAMLRNSNLLKSLDMAKARLRSRSTFSPVEELLEQAIKNYQRDLNAAAGVEDGEKDEENTENIYELVIQNVMDGTASNINN